MAADTLAPHTRPAVRTRFSGLVWLIFFATLSVGCGGSEEPESTGPNWRLSLEDLPGGLISAWGTSASDVWLVGGDPGDGKGGFILHYDGSEFRRRVSPVPGDLWWAHGFVGGPVYIGGANGTILKYEGDTFTKMDAPATQSIVFGIWGTAPDDLWAVGGGLTGSGAFVWRTEGGKWVDAPGLPNVPITHFFKVFGRSANDVHIVGADGVILHYDGSGFTSVASPTTSRLLTVHADDGGNWVAVGGGSKGVVVEDSGKGWQDVTPADFDKPLFGVRLADNTGYAVGVNGTIKRRSGGSWKTETHGLEIFEDFHAVWIDPTGGVWAVGGDILAPPLTNGMLAYKGKAKLPTAFVE